MNQDLSKIRRDYISKRLIENQMAGNPFLQFELWLKEAINSQSSDPTAATLSTVNKNSQPTGRIVLVKESNDEGFIFFTNYNSRKSQEIGDNNRACLSFYWDGLIRQVRIDGTLSKISREQNETYFNSRPRESQIMATISPQSEPIENRESLDKAFEEASQRLEGKTIPCPENWGGFLLKPNCFEFWQGRQSRLHDRIQYEQVQGKWMMVRLAP